MSKKSEEGRRRLFPPPETLWWVARQDFWRKIVMIVSPLREKRQQPGNLIVITASGNRNCIIVQRIQSISLLRHHICSCPSLHPSYPLMLALQDKQFRRTKRAACVNSTKLQTFNQDKPRNNNNINNRIQNNKRVIIVKPYCGCQEHHKTNYQCLTADGLGVASKTGKVYVHQRMCLCMRVKRRVVDSKRSLICSSPEPMSLLQQQCIWSDRKAK